MRVALFAAALIVAAPAAAQNHPATTTQAAPAEDDEILVLGKKDRDAQVRGFVRDLAVLNGTNPIARFDKTALCPGVAGLSPAQNAAIAARMRRVAQAADIALAVPGCRTNVLVLIAPNKDEIIRELRVRQPIYFQNGEEAIVIPKGGPTAAWHLGGYVDRSGAPVEALEGGPRLLVSTTTPSRISATIHPVFFAAVVVIERAALEGLTTTQVADYAAMRAFADVDPARLDGSSAPTILTVIEAPMDAMVPPTLTEWDLSYLRALYSVPADHFGPRQRTDIRRRMIREMDKSRPAAN